MGGGVRFQSYGHKNAIKHENKGPPTFSGNSQSPLKIICPKLKGPSLDFQFLCISTPQLLPHHQNSFLTSMLLPRPFYYLDDLIFWHFDAASFSLFNLQGFILLNLTWKDLKTKYYSEENKNLKKLFFCLFPAAIIIQLLE
jgi:hypothetical protein